MIECGSRFLVGASESSSGCLVSFLDHPEIVLMLGVCHGLVGAASSQGTAVVARDAPGQIYGQLRTWTNFRTGVTADAALVWVDPAVAATGLRGLGALAPAPNTSPQVGQNLRVAPLPGSSVLRSGRITAVGVDVPLPVDGPGWGFPGVTYLGHIICEPMFTAGGDSGAAAFDDKGALVGLVVGARPLEGVKGQTIVTPIAAILNHPDFNGQLQLVTQMPPNALPPTGPGAAPNVAAASGAPTFASLVPNGFFSSDPNDLKVPRSIRTNNPGALNFVTWEASRPGFVGKTEPDASADHNVTTIFRTPEHGVASWYHLLSKLYGFADQPSFTLTELAQHYAGASSGAAVDTYVTGWGAASGKVLTGTSSFAVTDDQAMLALARAMYTHEAGHPSPLLDAQIIYGMAQERAGTLPG